MDIVEAVSYCHTSSTARQCCHPVRQVPRHAPLGRSPRPGPQERIRQADRQPAPLIIKGQKYTLLSRSREPRPGGAPGLEDPAGSQTSDCNTAYLLKESIRPAVELPAREAGRGASVDNWRAGPRMRSGSSTSDRRSACRRSDPFIGTESLPTASQRTGSALTATFAEGLASTTDPVESSAAPYGYVTNSIARARDPHVACSRSSELRCQESRTRLP